jgi:hypothetical protein
MRTFVPLKRHTVPFILFLLVCFNSKAQSVIFLDGKIELGVKLGPSFFLGDLGGIRGKGKPFVKEVNFPFTKLLKGIYINYYPAEWIGFRIARRARYGRIPGQKTLQPYPVKYPDGLGCKILTERKYVRRS